MLQHSSSWRPSNQTFRVPDNKLFILPLISTKHGHTSKVGSEGCLETSHIEGNSESHSSSWKVEPSLRKASGDRQKSSQALNTVVTDSYTPQHKIMPFSQSHKREKEGCLQKDIIIK